ncbi:thioredoxin, variant [Neurospora crassa OR74A]|uniref:Thioredoxin, variant n=1 Tax=Neurospora crassa (strain ATCC 24698 / 74-OR23-1A / CBS 708.71 / DSM 1257 / FGSC 987) TaxID=367110 RepID=V5IQJ8_NEUCR|nr:thioredoxin, variant [Neurospora crassa OR74A]ESA44307.1 thioredoxin, variant [Neurospora crassa OR74A]|eukprot:XP_011392793.1 thioredoxin, variant [Neurospora crassa OR74A]
MSATVKVGSSTQWRQILSSSAIVVADFYADWCGPCKMIAPVFESLSAKYSKPNKITFCKIDVDSQQEVAQQYGVRAMPTFLILHNGSVIETIQGANPPALTAAVDKAVKLAGGAAGGGAVFKTAGHRLGGSGVAGSRPGTSVARPFKWDFNSLIKTIIAFIGLYVTSLFSLDPYKAAESSPFNKKNSPPQSQSYTGSAASKKPAPRATFKTLSDLGN